MAIPVFQWAWSSADQLSGNELGVKAVLPQQVLVAPLLDQVARVQHHDLTGVPNCGQAAQARKRTANPVVLRS